MTTQAAAAAAEFFRMIGTPAGAVSAPLDNLLEVFEENDARQVIDAFKAIGGKLQKDWAGVYMTLQPGGGDLETFLAPAADALELLAA